MKYVVSILAGCLCVFKCILYLCTVVYIFGRVCLMGVFYNCIHIPHIVYILLVLCLSGGIFIHVFIYKVINSCNLANKHTVIFCNTSDIFFF